MSEEIIAKTVVNFNSTMVRLKVQHFFILFILCLFQFHYGTIKSIGKQ